MNEPKKTEKKLVEVTLGKPHTHAGVEHPAGARIKVTEPVRDWLIKNQIVNAPSAQEGAK
jgi:hypothetical protein